MSVEMIPCRGNISGTSYFILQKLEFHKEALFFMLNICIVVNQFDEARAPFSTSLRWWSAYQDNGVIFDVNIF